MLMCFASGVESAKCQCAGCNPNFVAELMADDVTITFPRSAVVKFHTERNALTLEADELRKNVRLGTAFYHYMQLDKVTSPANKVWADRLAVAGSDEARKMILSRTDWTC